MENPLNLSQPEGPLYVLHQSTARALVPKIFTLLILGTIFFLAFLLNLSLLELKAQQEHAAMILSLVLVILLVVLGVFLALHQAHQPYLFYKNKLVRKSTATYYINITNTKPKQNPFDKVFKTYSINLGNGMELRHIPHSLNISDYLQQLISYASKT